MLGGVYCIIGIFTFSTLEKICEVLNCKLGDVLDYEK